MTNYTHYTDFLKDPQFIRWQIVPDEELDNYWAQFVQTNPQLFDEIEAAIRYFRTTGLNNKTLTHPEQEQLIMRIRKSIDERQHKKRIHQFIFRFAAACAVVLFVVGGIMHHVSSEKHRAHISGEETIVGNLLNSEDIRLIAGNKTTSFAEDITLRIGEDGETKVQRAGQTEGVNVKTRKDETNTLIVPYGKRSQITLSDGTKVWINSGSKLKFPTVFSGKTRDIFLNGEIYIEVAKNTQKPFYVHTPTLSVNVFGTIFNVSSYLNAPAEVVLEEGSVAIETNGSKNTTAIKLNPGQMATLVSDGTIKKKEVDVSKYTSWKDGYIILSQTPVSEALQQIERLYNLSFNMENSVDLKNKNCYGKLVLSGNLDDVLNTLAALSGTTYERNNSTITIKNR